MEEDKTAIAPDRLSIDTLANINEDVTWASEQSDHSRPPVSESVFSSLRQSIDGSSTHAGGFNILKQLNGLDDDKLLAEGSPLGPNSIFDLTAALDYARMRLNKGLKSMVLVNGGANRIYNLAKPSTREIPPIQLQPLQNKISNATVYSELVDKISDEYKAFELSYRSLTIDTLSQLSQQYEEQAEKAKLNLSDDEGEGIEQHPFPEVFETEEFHLEDQRVFRQVMEGSSIFPDNESSQELQLVHNTKVQEGLSHYLDTVEVLIVEEISQTADSFFATLDDIEEIKIDSQRCIETYDDLMNSLDTMGQKQADIGMELLNLIDQHRNINHLESSVLQLDAVLKGLENALKLANEGKNIECLNHILVLESLIKGVNHNEYLDTESLSLYPVFEYPLVDLSGLGALKNKQKSIEALKSTCCRGYIDEFINLLLGDLKSHISSVPTVDTINRMSITSNRSHRKASPLTPSYQIIDPSFRATVSEFIKNLAKSGYLVLAFAQYQDKIIREVKAIIRTRFPSQNSDASQLELLRSDASYREQTPSDTGKLNETNFVAGSTNGTLTNSIKAMSDTEFYNMMRDIYSSLSECLRRLTTHQKFLLDISLSSLPEEIAMSINVMSLDISNSINKSIEITQVRLTKVLNVRLEFLGDLPLKKYLQFFLLTSAYLQDCESINPGYNATEQGNTLNEWIKNHLNYFCHRTHSSALKRMVALCEKDTWKEYTGDQLQKAQTNVDEILAYKKFIESGEGFDGSQWVEGYLDYYSPEFESKQTETQPQENDENAKSELSLNDVSFFVPSFMPTAIQTAEDYIIFTRIFGARSKLVVQNLLAYFKVLNSRISLAILSAGATKTAGLRHITTRHLALCLQTVEFLCEFLKQIKSIFPSNIAFQDEVSADDLSFDQIIKSYEDHKQALISKIVSIMQDRTANHCSSILKLDLSIPITHPQQCHNYMEILVKETLTVSTVLGRYIGENELTAIMLQIFDNYKKLLVACFCSDLPQMADFNQKHSLLKDIDYFRVKLSDLPGYGNSGQIIWENVNSLPTIEDSRMEEVMRHNIEGERASARQSMELPTAAGTETSNPAQDSTPNESTKVNANNGSTNSLKDCKISPGEENAVEENVTGENAIEENIAEENVAKEIIVEENSQKSLSANTEAQTAIDAELDLKQEEEDKEEANSKVIDMNKKAEPEEKLTEEEVRETGGEEEEGVKGPEREDSEVKAGDDSTLVPKV
ncbi:hypothetical protein PUMCH_002010 [Australozyma saopauloensis]|uniref:Vacuolar protein sorting-associated protein 54 C-terminal domain-containing protein n=1 Tax=Australozyma saopauloensis TaxID=291208 RepID=A0AAX4H903_9ASCO|nr:hypothetical protein PUMCH_002010 [[Candida] saopauloensis]